MRKDLHQRVDITTKDGSDNVSFFNFSMNKLQYYAALNDNKRYRSSTIVKTKLDDANLNHDNYDISFVIYSLS